MADAHGVVGAMRTWHLPIFLALMFLPILTYLVAQPSDGFAPTIWICTVWATLTLWLLASFLPGNSFHLWIRREPSALRITAFALLILFGIFLPISSSVLTLSLSGAPITSDALWNATIKIFALGGVLWEGPKAAIPQFQANPTEYIQLITGSILYLSVGTKVLQTTLNPTNEGEIRDAIIFQLSLGHTANTRSLLESLKSDSEESWSLRLIHSLMIDDVPTALELAAHKFPSNTSFSLNPRVSALALLLPLSMQWRTSAAARASIWDAVVSVDVTEEDLLVLWLNCADRNNTFSEYSDKLFIEYARGKDYAQLLLAIAVSRQNVDEELVVRALSRCSLSEYVTLFTTSMRMVAVAETSGGANSVEVLEHCNWIMSTHTRVNSVAQIMLVSMAVFLTRKVAAKAGAELIAAVEAASNATKRRLLLFPNGPLLAGVVGPLLNGAA